MVSRLFDKALELLALIEERGRLKVTQGKNMVFAAFVVLQAIFYGADNVVMKVAYGEVSPLWCQTLRFGLAFALFMALFGKQIVKGLRGSRVSAWLPVGVVYAVAFVASSLAVDMTSATNAGFFISLPMLFTPVIALALMRRTYRLSTLVLQIAVLAGLYLLCCNGGVLSFGMGEFVGLGSSALFALGIVLSERGLSEIGPAAMSAVQTGGAFLFSLGGAVATEPAPAFGTVSVGTWGAVAFLAIAGTCLAFWLQNKALAHIPAATVSVILCSEPRCYGDHFLLRARRGALDDGRAGRRDYRGLHRCRHAARFSRRKRPGRRASRIRSRLRGRAGSYEHESLAVNIRAVFSLRGRDLPKARP